MSDNNLKTYNSTAVVKWYKQLDNITEVERTFFETNKDLVLRSTLLDIGIGGGRTTHYLIDKCKKYTGIDYSEGFVNSAKITYPKIDIRCLDARDLSVFSDDQFDIVNFSFNGIDYVNLEDRIKTIKPLTKCLG
jgi:SAM-dependent methyltransferase